MQRALFFIIIILFLSAMLSGCGKGREINHSTDSLLFGASLEEAGEILGIDTQEGEFSEEIMGPMHYKTYKTDTKYALHGHLASLKLYFWDQQAPDGQEMGLAMVRIFFMEKLDLDEFRDFLKEEYSLGVCSEGKDDFIWQGEFYGDLVDADTFEEIYEELCSFPPLIPVWLLELRQLTDRNAELILICHPAALVRYLDSFTEE